MSSTFEKKFRIVSFTQNFGQWRNSGPTPSSHQGDPARPSPVISCALAGDKREAPHNPTDPTKGICGYAVMNAPVYGASRPKEYGR